MRYVIINDKKIEIPEKAGTLLEMLRENLGLTGAKQACDNGECGSCIVLMNGKPTKSCLLSADRAAEKKVLTIEGLAPEAMDIQPCDDYSLLHPCLLYTSPSPRD